MSLHPIEVTDKIESSYIRYLSTAFHMKSKELLSQLQEELQKKNRFMKGPYLEITAPYQTGASLKDLVAEGVVSPLVNRLSQDDIPFDRPLYTHQEEAIRKVQLGRNLVVATGTGSGKTESFLIPILNYLFKQKENGSLSSGVRALLVYPMNALANDQIKRLRTLLANTPEITFGRYTGETREKKAQAEEEYRKSHEGQESLPNELLSREEMRENPPHLLITNYAMLEYLLLRPSDTPFFDGPYSHEWKFVVLDEAHTYNGAKGIEVAMLLRRFKDRILKERPYHGTIQCIATSATLGNGEEANQKVMKFASDLFDEKFEWAAGSPNLQDLIQAKRVNYHEITNIWGAPSWQAYGYLHDWLMSNGKMDLDFERLAQLGYPRDKLITIKKETLTAEQLLYEILKDDQNLLKLRDSLKVRPKILRELVLDLMENKEDRVREQEDILTKLVDLAVRAKAHEGDLPLLPARYHLFVRAIEGAYLSFLPKKKLFLDAQKYSTQGNNRFPVFELGVCRSCGQEHLIGEEEDGCLIQRKGINFDPDKQFNAYMIVDEEYNQVTDEDEEILTGFGDSEEKLFNLCPACAKITPRGLVNKTKCCSKAAEVKPILVVKEVIVRNKQSKCHHCGARSANPIRLFITGQDAATSVLSTSLYQELVSVSNARHDHTEAPVVEDDPFGFMGEIAVSSEQEVQYQPQKLLVFSDSRQDAAFFATYLDRTYQQIMWRRLLIDTLGDLGEGEIRLEDLVLPLEKKAIKAELFESTLSSSGRKEVIRTRLMNELLMMDRRISPEGVGLLSFHVPIPELFKQNLSKLAGPLKVSENEVWHLFEALFDSFRLVSAIDFPEDVDPTNALFQPRNRQGYMSYRNPNSRYTVTAWLASEGKMNRRLDYLIRIYEKKGMSNGQAKKTAEETLQNLWDNLMTKRMPDYFLKETHKAEIGVVHKMSYKQWHVKVNGQKWYQCSHCACWTTRYVEGVCPTMKCAGELVHKVPIEDSSTNHYHHLYKALIPMRMVTKEHTAQLSSGQATDYQESFIRNEINVLSCSTTFEMGVDVGGLEAVFMRNMPPETSNYIQRAGRAGRRKSTTAFALTYAQRRSHDLSYYQRPEKMIAGDVKPPIFKMDNEKIVRRHIHSVALASFLQKNPSYFNTVEDFFQLEGEKGERGLLKIRKYLSIKPSSVFDSLDRVIPDSIKHLYGIDKWAWLDGFISEENGILSKAESIYEKDLDELQKTKENNFKQDKDTGFTLRMIKTLKEKQLLAFLSSHNVLPKYGFPVDIVELQITHATAHQVTLQRDLKLAISEYAPGSEIVANGHMWKSVGVKRLPKYELPHYQYGHCRKCGHYQIISRLTKEKPDSQQVCENCFEPISVSTFITPIFGFVSAWKPQSPGEYRPEKLYSSRVFFSNYDMDDDKNHLEQEDQKQIGSITIEWKYSPFGKLAIVNSGLLRGYHICQDCGVEQSVSVSKGKKGKGAGHNTPWGSPCQGRFENVHLGHEFMSDVLELNFHGLYLPPDVKREDFWNSFLYGFLEGTSSVLGISRNDIDGCLYYRDGVNPALIIFDNVPGGAGYTKELPKYFQRILSETLYRLENCTCGEETSCYGCLRNYGNQYCHETLSRGLVVQSLNKISGLRKDMKYETEIDRILEVDESCRAIVENLKPDLVDRLVIGFDLWETDSGVVGSAELAWPDEKIAVLTEVEWQFAEEFRKRGWKVYLPEEYLGFLTA